MQYILRLTSGSKRYACCNLYSIPCFSFFVGGLPNGSNDSGLAGMAENIHYEYDIAAHNCNNMMYV